MATFAGVALWLLALPAFLINLYFLSLVLDLWPGLRRRLSALFRACRADTSTCAVVAATPYARLFGGLPNVTAGIPWCLALAALATAWLVSGRLFVPVPFLVVSLGTLGVAAYLMHALLVVLKIPCPLCMAGHCLHAAITVLLFWAWHVSK